VGAHPSGAARRSSARRRRLRRRLVALAVVATVVALVALYRDRELRRNSDSFVEQYGR